MVFGFDMKLPSFITGQLISLVASTYPFKFVAELSSAAATTPDCPTPPPVTGVAHIGFMAYFKEDYETVMKGDGGYESDDEEDWEEDEVPLHRKGHTRRRPRPSNSIYRGVKKFGKKTKDVFSAGVGVVRPDSN
jgi:hypothetical protein